LTAAADADADADANAEVKMSSQSLLLTLRRACAGVEVAPGVLKDEDRGVSDGLESAEAAARSWTETQLDDAMPPEEEDEDKEL
jgi:hypothetical protein